MTSELSESVIERIKRLQKNKIKWWLFASKEDKLLSHIISERYFLKNQIIHDFGMDGTNMNYVPLKDKPFIGCGMFRDSQDALLHGIVRSAQISAKIYLEEKYEIADPYQGHDYELIRGFDHVIQELIRYGADPNLQNSVGETPLHIAAQSKSPITFLNLLKYGADPRIQNHEKKTPIDIALSQNNPWIKPITSGSILVYQITMPRIVTKNTLHDELVIHDHIEYEAQTPTIEMQDKVILKISTHSTTKQETEQNNSNTHA